MDTRSSEARSWLLCHHNSFRQKQGECTNPTGAKGKTSDPSHHGRLSLNAEIVRSALGMGKRRVFIVQE